MAQVWKVTFHIMLNVLKARITALVHRISLKVAGPLILLHPAAGRHLVILIHLALYIHLLLLVVGAAALLLMPISQIVDNLPIVLGQLFDHR